jgi:hypothetical protein
MKILLLESLLGQRNFIIDAMKIISTKPDIVRLNNKLYKTLVASFKKHDLDKESLAQDKRKRKAAEVLVTKEMSKFIGYDGDPIQINKFSNLFEPILNYLRETSDTNFDDCLLAADIFMKKYYEHVADAEFKRSVELGKADFSRVFEITRFYKDRLAVDEVRGKENWVKIIDTPDIEVVYPLDFDAFKLFLKKTKVKDLTWCTQDEDTYYSYCADQYLLIVHEKNSNVDDENKIISLKIRRSNYELRYSDACNRYNIHMSKESINRTLSDEQIEYIIENAKRETDYFLPDGVLLEFEPDETSSIVEDLYNGNNKSIAVSLIRTVCSSRYDRFTALDIFEQIINFRENDFFPEVIAECLKSEAVLSVYREMVDTIKKEEAESGNVISFDERKVFEKHKEMCLVKRQHPKVFRLFCMNNYEFDNNSVTKRGKDNIEMFRSLDKSFYLEALRVICDTNNYNQVELAIIAFIDLLTTLDKNEAKEIIDYCVLEGGDKIKNIFLKSHTVVKYTEEISVDLFNFLLSFMGSNEEEILINTIFSGKCVDILDIAQHYTNLINEASKMYNMFRPELIKDSKTAVEIFENMVFYGYSECLTKREPDLTPDFCKLYFTLIGMMSPNELASTQFYGIVQSKTEHLIVFKRMLEIIGEDFSYLSSSVKWDTIKRNNEYNKPENDDEYIAFKFKFKIHGAVISLLDFVEEYYKAFRKCVVYPEDFEESKNITGILEIFDNAYAGKYEKTKLIIANEFNRFVEFENMDLENIYVITAKNIKVFNNQNLLEEETLRKIIISSEKTYDFNRDRKGWKDYIDRNVKDQSIKDLFYSKVKV